MPAWREPAPTRRSSRCRATCRRPGSSPWTMHSPWPKGSPFWYPDSKVQMVMWFNGGDGIHDASWRSRYGPGTNGPHYDPTGEDTGTHGCVNVPFRNMVWLWNWTPTGTPVIVY